MLDYYHLWVEAEQNPTTQVDDPVLFILNTIRLTAGHRWFNFTTANSLSRFLVVDSRFSNVNKPTLEKMTSTSKLRNNANHRPVNGNPAHEPIKVTLAGKESMLKTQISGIKTQIAEEGFKRPCWRVFLATTSAHGYPRIVDEKYPMLVRLVWVLLW